MNVITSQQLQDMFLLPASDAQARAENWTAPLNACMAARAIDTSVRQAAYLAQILVESSEFHHVQELLSYSAQRLVAVWPNEFPTEAIAENYSHNPEKLANTVYANRMGNGDVASGDGWKYRGRGLIQLTGRTNYTALSSAMDIDALNDPDLLLQPAGAALSAAWFWNSKQLNELADQATDASFEAITKKINGGTNGLAQRCAYWERAKVALGADLHPAGS